jgi:hypothetical protein
MWSRVLTVFLPVKIQRLERGVLYRRRILRASVNDSEQQLGAL